MTPSQSPPPPTFSIRIASVVSAAATTLIEGTRMPKYEFIFTRGGGKRKRGQGVEKENKKTDLPLAAIVPFVILYFFAASCGRNNKLVNYEGMLVA